MQRPTSLDERTATTKSGDDDEELVGLVSSTDEGKTSGRVRPGSPPAAALATSPLVRWRRLLIGAAFVVGSFAAVGLYVRSVGRGVERGEESAKVAGAYADDGLMKDDPWVDFPSTGELLDSLSEARRRFEGRMRGDHYYGEHYDLILGRNNETFLVSNVTRDRMTRRLVRKLLLTRLNNETSAFTFVGAGHSAAAAHGDLYNQSYSMTMEAGARDAFESVGMKVTGKNYAMGGMSSGPELAMCMESVYGTDVDVLSWDFGMTDGRDEYKLTLWGNRAAVHKSRPILFLAHWGKGDSGRWNRLKAFESCGMGAIRLNYGAVLDPLKEVLPDATNMANQSDIPSALQYFVCNGGFENGEPCKDHKFDIAPCTGGKFQTSWHPGWKMHLLGGSLIASFFMDMLEEAVNELDRLRHPVNETLRLVSDDPASILELLQSRDDEDEAEFRNCSVNLDVRKEEDKEVLAELNATVLCRSHSICHTALLPAQERYDGILMESGNKAGIEGGYDVGVPKSSNTLVVGGKAGYDNATAVPLVEVEGRPECEVLLYGDFKDVFLEKEGRGWHSMKVPNDAEVEAYGNGQKREGLIMMCLKACDWGKCPSDYVKFEEFQPPGGNQTSNLTIEVDGTPVVAFREFLKHCHFLEGPEGLRWGDKSGRGQYELKFLVNRTNANLYITTIAVL